MVKALYTPDDYDDLTDLVEAEGDKYKVEYKEAKKKKAATAKPVFPKVLKVHCHKKGRLRQIRQNDWDASITRDARV